MNILNLYRKILNIHSRYIAISLIFLQIFKCPNVKLLSLKYNCLDKLPVDIGRMKNLRFLALTNNKLQVQSIPYSLTFCRKLKTLMLDNNLLDALPGFLLKMPAIRTVHRHGNHNYFKSTFMWYHTDVGYRIIPSEGAHSESERNPRSLQFWAAKTVIGMKIDFFEDPSISVILQEYLSEIYHQFKVCHYCNSASFRYQPGKLISNCIVTCKVTVYQCMYLNIVEAQNLLV